MPVWNAMEKMVSAFMTNPSKRNKAAAQKTIKRLHRLLTMKNIMTFLTRQLRFPNMKITIIDYSNAGWGDRKKLDMYRRKIGIKDNKEKNTVLRSMKKLMPTLPKMDDEKLAKVVDWVKKELKNAAFEAKHTGERAYFT